MKKIVLAILLSGSWIGFSEFLRNELLFKHTWIEKYQSLGVIFPSSNLNNAIWGIWSFLFASLITYLSSKLKFIENVFVSWTFGFVLMWLVIGNLNVLPFKLLLFAIPLSIIEVIIASLIIYKVKEK